MDANNMDNFKDKIALVTGASGFIGRNLVGLLIEQGCKVAVLARGLLTEPKMLQEYIMEVNPDYIFHLASYGNHFGHDDKDEIFATNVMKTYILLNAAQSVDYKLFVNVSTSSVYGKRDIPLREDMTCYPETSYAITKYMGEQITKMFPKTLNIRPFSVYGAGEAEHRFIPTIIKRIEEQKKLYLAEQPVHDWIYIEDFVNALFKIIESKDKLENAEIINIGTGRQYTNKEIVEKLSKLMGKKAKIDILKPRSYDTDMSWVADTNKLSQYFTPEFSIEDGLKLTYEYYATPEKEETLGDAMKKSLDMIGQGGFEKIGDK